MVEAETNQDQEEHRPRSYRWLRTGVYLFGAVIIGILIGYAASPGEHPPDDSDEADDVAGHTALPQDNQARTLADARAYLRNGNVGEAYRFFRRYTAEFRDPPHEQLQYELAVAAEGVGDTARARLIYDRLALSAASHAKRAAASLGLARLRFREEKYGAVDSILSAGLRSGAFSVSPKLEAEAEYVRAVALSRRAAGASQQSLLRDDGLVWGRINWSVAYVLDLSDTGGEEPTEARRVRRKVAAQGQGPEAVVNASLPRQSVRETIDTLAVACGMNAVWDEPAARSAAIRNVAIHQRNRGLASLLDRILGDSDLIWRSEESRLMIKVARTDSPERSAWRTEAARRALWDVLAAHPGGRHNSLALLSLGNLDAVDDPLSADARYDELLRKTTKGDLLLATLFNRGKLALQLSEIGDARDNFSQAADHGRGTLIDAVALLYAGRMRLEGGEAGAAVDLLLRAESHLASTNAREAGRTADEQTATLAATVQTLAIAWLESGKPVAANHALMRHRPLLQAEPYHDVTAFLSALGAFRAASTEEKKTEEGRTLIAALAPLAGQRMFSENGTVLIGEAWRSVGLGVQMAAIYDERLPRVRSLLLRKRMLLSLVDHHSEVGNEAKVAELLLELTTVAGTEDTGIRLAAAQHAYRSGRFEDSLTQCRDLLDEPGADQAELLRLMGRIYEHEGNHTDAARCYAGLLPPALKSKAEDLP